MTKFKDINRNNEEIDIEAQTVASMTVSDGKNDSDISNNKKYTFSTVSCSKFVNGHINRTFVSDYVFNLTQKTLLPLEKKVLEKGLVFSPTPSETSLILTEK